ncbi:hypothetical protein TRL7639_04491 [Falsiruegeria litorea R37]|uniref:Uncharacterized protein n=2 Tax=Falsiruegeria litorea TaxID=1280831 RepID=A0A1Y5TVC8_9RHOB|nr:hypothetical protein TRL7639_04491 [Falsiruegeria litorea R37]
MLVVRKTTVLWMGLFLIFAMAGMVILPDTEIDNLQFLGWQDGFFSQMNHIQYFYIWSDFEPLSQLNAHLVRWLLYYPIFHFGPHDYFFYALYAAPISFLLARQKMWLVILVLLLMPFALSLRSGLAAIGLVSVYFVMFHRLNAGLVLTFGALLCVFSSATLLQASIFFCYVVYKRGLRLKEVIPLLIMLTFLVIGVSDKVSGALAGDVGYVDVGGSSNILIAYVMRGTIIVSFLHNNPRAYVYLALLVVLLIYVVRLLIKRGVVQGMRRVMLLCLLPGFVLEGLGVVAAFPIVVWALVPKYWRGLSEEKPL